MASVKKIGNYRFASSTAYWPGRRRPDAELSTDGDTGEIQLLISLGTDNEFVAVKRAEKILRDLTTGEKQNGTSK